MKTETIWLDVPILVKCLRKRCHKVDHYLMMRPLALPLRSFTDEQAPATLLVERAKDCSIEMLPGRKTESVRRLPDGWATPLVLPDGTPVDPSDPAAPIRKYREGLPWADSPFSIDQNIVSRLKPDVYAEKDLVVVEMETDLELATSNEVASLVRNLVLIDGVLHKVRTTPSLLVVVTRLGYGARAKTPDKVSINAALVEVPDNNYILAYQRFRPDRIDEAVAYANRVVRTLNCAGTLKSQYATNGFDDDTDDFHAFVTLLRTKFVEQAQSLVGCMGRPRIEAYLDLRDGAEGDMDDAAFVDGYLSFFLSVLADETSSMAVRLLEKMQYDVMRIEVERPGLVVFAGTTTARTLAALDEEAFLHDM